MGEVIKFLLWVYKLSVHCTVVPMDPSGLLGITTSEKAKFPSDGSSRVNWMMDLWSWSGKGNPPWSLSEFWEPNTCHELPFPQKQGGEGQEATYRSYIDTTSFSQGQLNTTTDLGSPKSCVMDLRGGTCVQCKDKVAMIRTNCPFHSTMAHCCLLCKTINYMLTSYICAYKNLHSTLQWYIMYVGHTLVISCLFHVHAIATITYLYDQKLRYKTFIVHGYCTECTWCTQACRQPFSIMPTGPVCINMNHWQPMAMQLRQGQSHCVTWSEGHAQNWCTPCIATNSH